MPKKSGLAFMTAFVEDYLAGKEGRLDWDVNFSHYFMLHYPKMERESRDAAECFNFYLAEQGYDQGMGLPDDEHKALIRKQFELFNDTVRDGFF